MSEQEPRTDAIVHTHIRIVEDRGVVLVVTSNSPELDWERFNLGDVGLVRVIVLRETDD